MNAVKDQVTQLVQVELAAANERFPAFRSRHEGYAVMLEETDEAADETNKLREHMLALWDRIKGNNSTAVRADLVKDTAIALACEAIQVAAMAQKYLDMEAQNEADRRRKA